jgi:hypothetical protein
MVSMLERLTARIDRSCDERSFSLSFESLRPKREFSLLKHQSDLIVRVENSLGMCSFLGELVSLALGKKSFVTDLSSSLSRCLFFESEFEGRRRSRVASLCLVRERSCSLGRVFYGEESAV